MAGIEKICEVCGTHKGDEMWYIKHNDIQVCNDCRKVFKGKNADLFYSKETSTKSKYLKGYFEYEDGTLRDTAVHFNYFLHVEGLDTFWNYSGDIKAVKYHMRKLTKKPIKIYKVPVENLYGLYKNFKGIVSRFE